jgi:hypothetical protein
MENNLVIFEYDKRHSDELGEFLNNVSLVRAGDFDTVVLAISEHFIRPANGIHVRIREHDRNNTNFMILLGLYHPLASGLEKKPYQNPPDKREGRTSRRQKRNWKGALPTGGCPLHSLTSNLSFRIRSIPSEKS